MGRRKEDNGLDDFNKKAFQNGITYAEVQKRETREGMKRIRVPRTEKSHGEPVYMTVAARNKLKNIRTSSTD